MIMPDLDTYFLEVSANAESRHRRFFDRQKTLRISLGIFELFSKVKRKSSTKVNYVFFIILEYSDFLEVSTSVFNTYFSGYWWPLYFSV